MADVDRSKRAVLTRISYGQFSTKAPFGYRFSEKQLILDPVEAPIVKALFDERSAGKGIRELARFFGLSAMKVKRILENPVYIGKLRWQGKLHNATHTPIVDEKLFNSIQKSYQPKVEYSFEQGVQVKKVQYNFKQNEEKKLEKVKQGFFPSKAPLGYFIRNSLLQKKPSQSAIVKKLFEEFRAGASLSSLSSQYEIPVARVRYLLSNPTYTGRIPYKSILYPGNHQPLIDLELFEHVQEKISRRHA